MKNVVLSSIALVGIVSMAFIAMKKDKSTLKDKIDRTEKVHVFFSYSPIVHDAVVSPEGKGCARFDDQTELTEFYKSQESNIFSLLNEGFETTDKFVVGDITSLEKKEVMGVDVYNYATGSAKVGDIVLQVAISGTYKALKTSGSNNSLNLSMKMLIWEVVEEGKVKLKGQPGMLTSSEIVKTKTCQTYDYFVTNFPLDDYQEQFKEDYTKKLNKFILKMMEKHEKAVSKR